MNTNVSLLTSVASQVTDKRILDYEVAVFEHINGDWNEHSELCVYGIPFQSSGVSVTTGVCNVVIYGSATDNGSGITLSGELTSFASTTINFGPGWKPVSGVTKYGADVSGTLSCTNAATFDFSMTANIKAYLFVDGSLVGHVGGGSTNNSLSVALGVGLHNFEIQYKGGGHLVLAIPNGLTLASTALTHSQLADNTLRLAMDVEDPSAHSATSKVIAVPCLTGLGTFTASHQPIIIEQPNTQQVKVGSSVIFSVVAICDYQMAYQWYFNSEAITGAIASVYSINSTVYANAGNYTVTVSSATASTTSLVAQLTLVS